MAKRTVKEEQDVQRQIDAYLKAQAAQAAAPAVVEAAPLSSGLDELKLVKLVTACIVVTKSESGKVYRKFGHAALFGAVLAELKVTVDELDRGQLLRACVLAGRHGTGYDVISARYTGLSTWLKAIGLDTVDFHAHNGAVFFTNRGFLGLAEEAKTGAAKKDTPVNAADVAKLIAKLG